MTRMRMSLNHHIGDRPIIRYGTLGSLLTAVASRNSPEVTCADQAVEPFLGPGETKQRHNGMRLKRHRATRTYFRNDAASRAGIHQKLHSRNQSMETRSQLPPEHARVCPEKWP